MVVEHNPDDRLPGIMIIDMSEQRDELLASVALFDIGDHLSGMEIQGSQNGHGSMTHVFMIPGSLGMLPRLG